ncbi:hypothetical protein BU16DRAFT_585199 [Lophium mytilinum]|uniref:Uncharacterized protein n=1 Tax=Lophium mytilinum TaxID=390894 RepID=A0A6A6QGT0_9PEZI|nr:hypothetical protein BU16DRAFT_585199 [Lophium mytilinum]
MRFSNSLVSADELAEWRLLLPETPWATLPNKELALLVAEHKDAERRRKEDEVKRFLVRHGGVVADKVGGSEDRDGDGETLLEDRGDVAEEGGKEDDVEREDVERGDDVERDDVVVERGDDVETGRDGEEQGEKEAEETVDEEQDPHEGDEVDDAERSQSAPVSECPYIDKSKHESGSAPAHHHDAGLSELKAIFNAVLLKFVTAAEGLRDFNHRFQSFTCEREPPHIVKDTQSYQETRMKDGLPLTQGWEHKGSSREFETSVEDAIGRLRGLIRELGVSEKTAEDSVKNGKGDLEEGVELDDARFQDADE